MTVRGPDGAMVPPTPPAKTECVATVSPVVVPLVEPVVDVVDVVEPVVVDVVDPVEVEVPVVLPVVVLETDATTAWHCPVA